MRKEMAYLGFAIVFAMFLIVSFGPSNNNLTLTGNVVGENETTNETVVVNETSDDSNVTETTNETVVVNETSDDSNVTVETNVTETTNETAVVNETSDDSNVTETTNETAVVNETETTEDTTEEATTSEDDSSESSTTTETTTETESTTETTEDTTETTETTETTPSLTVEDQVNKIIQEIEAQASSNTPSPEPEEIIEEPEQVEEIISVFTGQIIEATNETCLGCVLNDNCYDFNDRKKGQYCLEDGTWMDQTAFNETCVEDFECGSNNCIDGQCGKFNLLNSLINWIKGMFNFEFKTNFTINTSNSSA